MGDGLRRGAAQPNADRFRVAHGPLDQPFDLGRDRRGKEQRLALLARRALFEHAPHVGQETHVEQTVGLVEYDELQFLEGKFTALQVVQGASRE